MNYEEMSDFDINSAVASKLGVFWHVRPCNSESGGWVYSGNYEECNTLIGQIAVELPDYCNNPSDAWQIIVKNKIHVHPVNRVKNYNERYESWEASVTNPYICEECENPLRAAMIVFLMMKE